jgi:hypothetical protein
VCLVSRAEGAHGMGDIVFNYDQDGLSPPEVKAVDWALELCVRNQPLDLKTIPDDVLTIIDPNHQGAWLMATALLCHHPQLKTKNITSEPEIAEAANGFFIACMIEKHRRDGLFKAYNNDDPFDIHNPCSVTWDDDALARLKKTYEDLIL